ncbi:MAG: YebC/PmpR family DNA-binding transcriptional regulator [Chloroflexi bacterium]|nr:YebC/PmpR family DNA-binding transcriptional regulator [Chloroflexota bacterium]MBI4504795.1 YebC/PmpR family DNA-binding transcriptional regulator [Chloroflexota bacterium]
MSGHSKWAQIKRQKAVTDVRKGQLFTKLGREITVAAREGGADAEANYRLRLVIERAREHNMPMDTIERAIKRAAGGGEGAALEQVMYEGYGPGGAAVLVEIATDNRNRTAAEVRNVFTRGGGNLGEVGSVSWLFESRGVIAVEPRGRASDDVVLLAIDAGAQDVQVTDGAVEVYTDPKELARVRRGLDEQGLAVASAEITMVAKSTIQLDDRQQEALVRLLERLEELDDVQRVHTNVEFSADMVAQMGAHS